MASTSTFASLFAAVGEALSAVAPELVGDDALALLYELGLGAAEVPDSLNELADLVDDVAEGVADVRAALDAADGATAATLALSLAGDVELLVERILTLGADLEEDLDPDAAIEPGAFAKVGTRLLHRLLVRYLEDQSHEVARALAFLGVIHQESVEIFLTDDEIEAGGIEYAATHETLDLELLEQLVTDPEGVLAQRYGWGAISFDSEELFDKLFLLARGIGVLASREWRENAAAPEGPAHVRELSFALTKQRGDIGAIEFGMKLVGAEPTTPGGVDAGLDLSVYVIGEVPSTLDLDEDWSIELADDPSALAQVTLTVRPPLDISLSGPGADELSFGVDVVHTPLEPIALLAAPGLFTLTAAGVRFGVSTVPGPGAREPLLTLGLDGVTFSLETGEGDGFLASTLLSSRLDSTFDIDLSWSRSAGFRLGSSDVLAQTFPIGLQAGPVSLWAVTVGLGSDEGALSLWVEVSASVQVGPVTFAVEGVGVVLPAALAPEGGSAGVLDLAPPRFVPPSGLGVGIDTDVVSGGGFLLLDADAGEYAGVVFVEAFGVGVSATGILVTGTPPSQDWSFVLMLAVDLPPLPLGFGFTLNRIGGLFGLDRSVATEVLQAGLKTGSLDFLLFPDDPIGDIALILAGFESAFPIVEGQTLFGPMVEIGWSQLLTAQLGVIVELPDPVRVSILGQLSIGLPTLQSALVELNVDVLGVLDLDAGLLSIDATLRDSHVVGFALTGDMAVRLNWLGDPAFTLAVGGFHPQYPAPPDFPTLERFALYLDCGENPQISIDGYFAVTSNSVQFGAHFDFFMKAALFTVEAYAGFDVLVEFAPFGVAVDLELGATVKAGSTTLLGVDLALSVKGPSPWEVTGNATFEIVGVKTGVAVDVVIGERQTPPPVEAVDAGSLVFDALSDTQNWNGIPPSAGQGVTLAAALDAEAGFLVPPAGHLEIRQSVAPLDEDIEIVGGAPVSGAVRFAVTAVTVDGSLLDAASWPEVEDWFAPAQFFELPDDEKITGAAFEQMQAGVAIGADVLTSGEELVTEFEYESIVVDPGVEAAFPGEPPAVPSSFVLSLEHQFLQASRAGKTLSARSIPSPAPLVAVLSPVWVAASKLDLMPVELGTLGSSGASQRAAVRRIGAVDVQVVPVHEVVAP